MRVGACIARIVFERLLEGGECQFVLVPGAMQETLRKMRMSGAGSDLQSLLDLFLGFCQLSLPIIAPTVQMPADHDAREQGMSFGRNLRRQLSDIGEGPFKIGAHLARAVPCEFFGVERFCASDEVMGAVAHQN